MDLLNAGIAISALIFSGISVFISGFTAYLTYFHKKVGLVVNVYDDVIQEKADYILVFTNIGNVSLAVPQIQIGNISSDGKRRMLVQQPSFDRCNRKSDEPLVNKRVSSRVIEPGGHLEFLLRKSESTEQKTFLEFETVTDEGISLYFEETFKHRFSVQLTPKRIRVNKPPFWSRHETFYSVVWQRTRVDDHYRGRSLFGRFLNLFSRKPKNPTEVQAPEEPSEAENS